MKQFDVEHLNLRYVQAENSVQVSLTQCYSYRPKAFYAWAEFGVGSPTN